MLVLPRAETHGFLVSHALRTKLTEVINKKIVDKEIFLCLQSERIGTTIFYKIFVLNHFLVISLLIQNNVL